MHLVALARRRAELDCSRQRAPSVEALLALVRDAAVAAPAGTWIRAFGYDESFLLEKRAPSVAELDRAAPGHPVRLLHRTGHAAVLSTRAFREVGVSVRDVVYEPATLLRKKIPSASAADLAALLAGASEKLLQAGVTCLHDPTPGQSEAEIDALERHVSDGRIRQRVVTYGAREAFPRRSGNQPRFRHAGVKIVVTEESDASTVAEDVAAADRAGAQIALHAVEGGPLVVAIDALRRLGPERVRARRHRIEHAALCPPALCREIADSGATVVTHPGFLASFGEKYASELCAQEQAWLYPLRSLRDAGVPLALASDGPIGAPEPLATIAAAVRREGRTGARLGPAEAVDAAEALRMHTLGGAIAAGQGGEIGSIEPGKLADLVVLDGDPTTAPAAEIASIRVCATVVAGEVAWAG